jgi:nitrogen regulatory protein PII
MACAHNAIVAGGQRPVQCRAFSVPSQGQDCSRVLGTFSMPLWRRARHRLTPVKAGGANQSISNPYRELETIEVDLTTTPANFFCISAIIRPWRLSAVVSALGEAGIRGLTVTDVRGLGAQGGSLVMERDAGNEAILGSLVEKTKVEVILSREQVNFVVSLICTTCYTGSVGDGKIFVSPVADVVRVRTGETGAVAERMQDGLADKGYTSAV